MLKLHHLCHYKKNQRNICLEDNKAHVFTFSQAFNNDKSKTPIIFFLEFSAVLLTPIYTNSYPKLCVVYTLLNRFATNLLNVPEKKIHSAEFSLKALLRIVTFVWYCYLFNEYRIIFQQQQLQNYLQIISYKGKEHNIWNNFPFLSLLFLSIFFIFFSSFLFLLLYNLCKYFPEIYARICKKPWPVGMRHIRRKCIVYLIINLRGFREN